VTGAAQRRTVTSSFTLEQSVESVWKTLVAPQALMWLLPKAAYVVAPPEAPESVGELRCCWLNQWKKGIRQQTVWELLTVEPGRQVTYLSRSRPSQGSFEFQLDAADAGTRVELIHQKRTSLKDRLLGHELRVGPSHDPTARLIAAAGGEWPEPITAGVMTWAPGISGREQNNDIVIAAPPERIWAIIAKQDATVVSWRAVVDDVEYRYCLDEKPGGELVAEMSSFIPAGRLRVTTVDSRGVEVAYGLLPHEEGCLLRTTTRWTALIKARAIRKAAQARLAAIKQIAENATG
jgi:uncharacterized protein YndB with AHSA1/START domain